MFRAKHAGLLYAFAMASVVSAGGASSAKTSGRTASTRNAWGAAVKVRSPAVMTMSAWQFSKMLNNRLRGVSLHVRLGCFESVAAFVMFQLDVNWQRTDDVELLLVGNKQNNAWNGSPDDLAWWTSTAMVIQYNDTAATAGSPAWWPPSAWCLER